MELSLGLGFKVLGSLSLVALGKSQLMPHIICSSQEPVMKGPFSSPIYSRGNRDLERGSCSPEVTQE